MRLAYARLRPGPDRSSPLHFRRFLATLGLFAVAAAQPAAAQDISWSIWTLDDITALMPKLDGKDWDIRLGAGTVVVPKYEGAKNFKAMPLPLIDVTWKDRVYLNPVNGAGVYVVDTPEFDLGVGVTYRFGRDQDDSARLKGLGDIDGGLAGRIFAAYWAGPFSVYANATSDFGGRQSATGEVGALGLMPLSEKLALRATAFTTWADDRNMETFYGVTATQSAKSGLPQFNAKGGFKRADAAIALSYRFAPSWSLDLSVGTGYLLGDAADSPVTERRWQPLGTAFIAYRF